MNESLYANLDAFLSTDASADKATLVATLKESFLATLSHAEEKVSLAAQCFNAVEKHLCKLEDDLKCFEEEIRLAGYDELLRNARASRTRAKEDCESAGNSGSKSSSKSANSNNNNNSSSKKRTRSERLQQQQQQQQGESTGTKRTRRNSIAAGQSEDETGSAQLTEMTRAERLLRRTKPSLQPDESVEKDNEGDDEGSAAEDQDTAAAATATPETPEPPADSKMQQKPSNEEEDKVEFKSEPPAEELAEPPKRTTRSRSNSVSSANPSEPLYCFCKKGSFGQMIACDNTECPVEWFHYSCVGLKGQPKGKWFCSRECQDRRARRK